VDPITLPDDITTVEADELQALDSSLRARAAELRAQAAESGPTPELAALATETAAAFATVHGEVTRRDQMATDVASLSAVPEPAPVEPAPAPAAEPAAPVTAATEPTEPAPAEPAPAALAAEPPAPAPVEPVEPVLVPDAVTPPPISPAQLSAVAPGAVQPGPGLPTVVSPLGGGVLATAMRATGFTQADGMEAGTPLLDRFEVARAIAETKEQLSRSTLPPGTRAFTSLAHANWQRDYAITADPEVSHGAMWSAVHAAMPAIVAAGPCCTPLSPMYDFCRLASPKTPVEDCLPVMGAPRGGIRYIVTPDWRAALAGIGQQCCGDNDDPEDPVLKPCVTVECPTLEDVTVCAVSQCVTFDNLQYRTFPELVANFLDDLAVAFAMRKEIAYLDDIHAASTAVTGFDTGYGAIRQFIFNLVLAAEAYRRRNRMAEDARLSVLAPAWVKALLAVDMVMDAEQGMNRLAASDAEIAAFFSSWNLSVCWYADSATGQDQAFDLAQAAGALNFWPDAALVYLFSPGTFVRLDGGTLDVGLVRDSILNRQNNLQMFMEEWTAIAQLCPESIALTIPMCPTGAAVERVAALVCPA
jgi:hypothetical protein